jgi:manganese efflux pump family protein
MDFLQLLLIAIGLAADSFAVSVSSGAIIGTMHLRHAFRIAIFFSFFQGLMPWIGWKMGGLAGDSFRAFDHWIAFVMLCLIGGKMVYESRNTVQEEVSDPLNIYILFTLAIATSIDALAVGVTFSFLDISIAWPVLVIGVTTFLFSFTGTYIGQIFGHLFEDKIELVGGLILIGIGFKILIEHLLAG